MRRGLRARALGVSAACLVAAACGSLDSPTRPEPTPDPGPQVPIAAPAPNATPTPVLGLPGPAPTPTPEATPTPSPTPGNPAEGASACGDPQPPPLSKINVKIHMKGADAWVIDSTPLVGPDAVYCAKIGFTDGRLYCPVRPEGNPQRGACELFVTGQAKDTGRAGPTWYFDGNLCTGPAMGCKNSPDNQYQALVYRGGLIQACGVNGVCGEVAVER